MANPIRRAPRRLSWQALLAGSALLVFLVGGAGRVAQATPFDVWSLSGDFSNASNPGAAIDPGALGGGTGSWSYFSGGPALFPEAILSNPAAEANGELPTSGIGWTLSGGSHVSMSLFSSSDGSKTNFVAGDVGGHGPTTARWTTDHAATFMIEWLAYNGRDQSTASGSEAGRVGTLIVNVFDTSVVATLDTMTITGGVQDGSALAYNNSAIVSLSAGQSIQVFMSVNDWAGMDLTITELPEPSTGVLLGLSLALLAVRRR